VGLGQMQKLLLKPLFTKYLAVKACKMLAVRKNDNKYFFGELFTINLFGCSNLTFE
jgi:hypothetical protein